MKIYFEEKIAITLSNKESLKLMIKERSLIYLKSELLFSQEKLEMSDFRGMCEIFCETFFSSLLKAITI